MGLSILSVVAIAILAILVFRRGPDELVVSNERAKWVLRLNLILLGVYAAFWLLFGIGEMISGDFSGVIHLIPAIMIAILMLLAMKRPIEAGIVLIVLGVLASIYYFTAVQGGRGFQIQAVLIGGAPFLVFGTLFLVGGALARLNR